MQMKRICQNEEEEGICMMSDIQKGSSSQIDRASPGDRMLVPDQLKAYGAARGYQDYLANQVCALLRHQRDHWPMLSGGFSSLESVQMRSFEFNGFEMKLQYNAARMASSTAKIDEKSIKARPCFLCQANLPPEQKAIPAGDYVILGNPFPIFSEHFTISHQEHIPQLIGHSFDAMLDLSKAMGNHYTLFYNGPKSGASVPDHLHFQGVEWGAMPLDCSWREMITHHGNWIIDKDRIRVARVDDGLRRYIILESDDKKTLAAHFQRLYISFKWASRQAGITSEDAEEPMSNVHAAMENNRWRIIVFMRRKHRPSHYFLERDRQILFSPAAVDFGGVCITPVERDFVRLTAEDLRSMFEEVSATREMLDKVAGEL